MTAHAQALADYNATIASSTAVQFFRSTPRWPTAANEFQFSLSYLTNIALTALIPLLFALVLLLALAIHVIIRFTCRHRHTVARLERLAASHRATLVLIPLSAALLMFIFVFTSLGLLGNATLNQSTKDALHVLEALVNDLSRTGFAVVDTAIYLHAQLEAFSPNGSDASAPLSQSVGDLVTPAFQATKTFILGRYPDVSQLRAALTDVRAEIVTIFTVVRRVVGIVYSIMLAIMLLLVSAPPLLRVATARSVARVCAMFAYLLYLCVPSLLAWAVVGVMSGVGATVADVCASLTVYRDSLRGIGGAGGSGNMGDSSNAFIASGFTCPDGLSADSLKQQIGATAESILQSELARSTVERILSTRAEEIAETAAWTSDQVPRYLNCSALIELSGQMEFIVCGKEGRSAIDGVWNLWVAFIGLALCLSVAMFASLMGVHVMRAFDVWPSKPYGGVGGDNADADSDADVHGGSEGDGDDGKRRSGGCNDDDDGAACDVVVAREEDGSSAEQIA